MPAPRLLQLLKMPAETAAPPDGTFTTHDRERLVEVATTLGFVNTTLAEIKTNMATAAQNARTDQKELEARVRTLENFRWWIVGGSAASAIAGELLFKAMSR